jgi:hypothetical protein
MLVCVGKHTKFWLFENFFQKSRRKNAYNRRFFIQGRILQRHLTAFVQGAKNS